MALIKPSNLSPWKYTYYNFKTKRVYADQHFWYACQINNRIQWSPCFLLRREWHWWENRGGHDMKTFRIYLTVFQVWRSYAYLQFARQKILKGWRLCKRRVCNYAYFGGNSVTNWKTNESNQLFTEILRKTPGVQWYSYTRAAGSCHRGSDVCGSSYCERPCRLHAIQERWRDCLNTDGEPGCDKFSVHLECGAAPLGDRCPSFQNSVGVSTTDNKI
jgi:hypothetical protein